jgi:hypothetical protein
MIFHALSMWFAAVVLVLWEHSFSHIPNESSSSNRFSRTADDFIDSGGLELLEFYAILHIKHIKHKCVDVYVTNKYVRVVTDRI